MRELNHWINVMTGSLLLIWSQVRLAFRSFAYWLLGVFACEPKSTVIIEITTSDLQEIISSTIYWIGGLDVRISHMYLFHVLFFFLIHNLWVYAMSYGLAVSAKPTPQYSVSKEWKLKYNSMTLLHGIPNLQVAPCIYGTFCYHCVCRFRRA